MHHSSRPRDARRPEGRPPTAPRVSRGLLLAALLVGATGLQLATLGGEKPTRTDVALLAAAAKPNIVFITTDDMRVGDLRVMPNVRNLLTDQGTSFLRSYAPFPLCCPARASWVTGQYNHNNGVMGNQSEESPEGGYVDLDSSSTVATWLRGAGYQTAFVGKFINGYGAVKPVVVPPGWVEWHASVGGGNYLSTRLRENTGGTLATRTYEGTYQVDLYDSIARDIIRRRAPKAAPLFLWVSQFAPHSGAPTEADDPALATPAVPRRWRDFYAAEPLPKDPSFNEADVSDKPAFVRANSRIGAGLQAQVKEANAQRWESLRAVDESVKRIVDALRATGELDNTVIAFTSDNGFMMGEHRLHAGKTVAYEPSARVPLVIRGPGFPKAATRSPLVANIDIAPTFADLADATPDIRVDGRSLLPLAASPAGWPARTIVLEAGPRRLGGPDIYHGIRTPRYKYIEHSTGEVELYDLVADPFELSSLTDDPAHDATQAELREELSRMETCAGAACR